MKTIDGPEGKSKRSCRILDSAAQINAAVLLIKLNARSAMVQHFTGLADVKVRALCHELGMPPTKGHAPTNHMWFTRQAHRAEAIVFYTIVLRTLSLHGQSNLGVVPANVFIEGYQRYIKHITSASKLDINRAWQLLETIQQKKIQAIHCEICSGLHLMIDGDVNHTSNTCMWCQINQYRYCPECHKKHINQRSGVPMFFRFCNDCKNARRLVKPIDIFTVSNTLANS